MSDEMIMVYEARNNVEADIIKGMLESEGINVFVQGYNFSGMYPGIVRPYAYTQCNIMVPGCDAEKARQCIAQAHKEGASKPANVGNSGMGIWLLRLALILIILAGLASIILLLRNL